MQMCLQTYNLNPAPVTDFKWSQTDKISMQQEWPCGINPEDQLKGVFTQTCLNSKECRAGQTGWFNVL